MLNWKSRDFLAMFTKAVLLALLCMLGALAENLPQCTIPSKNLANPCHNDDWSLSNCILTSPLQIQDNCFLSLTNVKIQGTYISVTGSGSSSKTSVHIKHSKFTGAYDQPALRIDTPTHRIAILEDVTFEDNTAGDIYIKGTVDFYCQRCVSSGAETNGNGALILQEHGSNLTVVDSSCKQSRASYGGCIYSESSQHLFIRNFTSAYSVSKQFSSFLHAKGVSNILLNDIKCIGNEAEYISGCIGIDYSTRTGNFKISNVLVKDTVAAIDVGGMYIIGGGFGTVEKFKCINVAVAEEAGCLFFYKVSSLTLHDIKGENVVAADHGGLIYVYSVIKPTITQVQAKNVDAGSGSVLFINQCSDVHIKDVTIINSRLGLDDSGAIHFIGAYGKIENVYIRNATHGDAGGCLCVTDVDPLVEFRNLTCESSNAKKGAVLYTRYANVKISDLHVDNCNATNGAVIYNQGSVVEIDKAVISRIYAKKHAALIFWSWADVDLITYPSIIRDTKIHSYDAGKGGKLIYFKQDYFSRTLQLFNTEANGCCHASSCHAVFLHKHSHLEMFNSRVYGGTVYQAGSKSSFTNDTVSFVENNDPSCVSRPKFTSTVFQEEHVTPQTSGGSGLLTGILGFFAGAVLAGAIGFAYLRYSVRDRKIKKAIERIKASKGANNPENEGEDGDKLIVPDVNGHIKIQGSNMVQFENE